SLRLADVMSQVGRILLAARAWTEAEPVLREALAIREAKEPDAWSTFNTRSLLGGALLGQKRYAEAEPLFRGGSGGRRQRAEQRPLQGKDRLVEALDRLIELAEATKRPDDAKRWKDERVKLAGPTIPQPGTEKE